MQEWLPKLKILFSMVQAQVFLVLNDVGAYENAP